MHSGYSQYMMLGLLLLVPFMLLGLGAQAWVHGSFRKWSRVALSRGMTGADVAATILRANGVTDVGIEPSHGTLSDHYDPRSRVIRLSEGVYGGRSIAAAAIAAHETGHALQHATGYVPLALRSLAVPAAISADKIVMILVFLGIFLQSMGGMLFFIAGCIYSVAVVLALITLPVEFNASSRALAQLEGTGVVHQMEVGGARAVLTAAASTYVVAALVSIAMMLRFFLMAASRR